MKSVLTLLLLVLLAFPAQLSAQEQEEMGQLIMVNQWQVEPSHIPHQNAEIEKLVEAAGKAKLMDPGASWYFWTSTNTYTVVYPFENFAFLDNPMAFQDKFKGTAGEAMMQEAFASMQSIPTFGTKSEILMHMPEWSYEPEQNIEFSHAQVMDIWLKPGQEEAFGTLVKDVVEQDKRISNPYLMNGYRVIFGDVDRFVFVRFFDDPAKFHGENNREHLMAAMEGETEKWQEIAGEFLELTQQWEERIIEFRPELSFDASAMESAGE